MSRADAGSGRLSPLTAASVGEAGALLAAAFLDDPVVRYYFEDRHDRAELTRTMMTAATALTVCHGIGFRLDRQERLAGVALLLRPDRRDFPLASVAGAVLSRPRLWRPRSLRRYFGVVASVDAYRPELPCWTLVSLGIVPSLQRQGLGSSMLQQVLRHVPADQSVFLETYNERNLRFYGNRGFELTHAFVADRGRGPRTWTMLRPPDAAS